MNKATTKIEELGIRKDEALSNQERLNKYFELALEGNINITRDEITSLLEKFNFSEEEQREAAKLLMFPEDGLFEYESSYKNRQSGKSISDVFKEAKETKTPVIDVEPVVKPESIDTFKFDFMKDIEDATKTETPVISEINTNSVEPSKEKSKDEPTKESLIKLLESLGYDYLDFTSNDFEKLLANYDEDTIIKNTEYIKSLKITLDFFADNVELLYDKEMPNKIEKLTSIGKMPQDIYLNPAVLTKYDLKGLSDAINLLNQSGLEPKNVPLIAY